MDCTVMKRTFPALMAGDLPVAETGQAEEHLLHCENCSREFEAYESRFYMQYEPAGKAMAAAAKAALPELQVERFRSALEARLQGDCPRVAGLFARFLGAELNRAESDGVAAHLQGCEPCSRAFESYETRVFGQVEPAGLALAAAAKSVPPEGPMAGFWNKVSARIAEDRRRASWCRLTWALNAAALLIIGVSMSYLVAGQPPVDLEPAAPATATAEPSALPPNIESPVPAVPASTGAPVKRYSIDNVRAGDADPRRRPGGLEVIQAQGLHGVDSVKPLGGGEGVGF